MRGDFQQQPCAFNLPGLSLHLKTRVMLLHRTLPVTRSWPQAWATAGTQACFSSKGKATFFWVPKKEDSNETLRKNSVSSLHRGLATFKDQKVKFSQDVKQEEQQPATRTQIPLYGGRLSIKTPALGCSHLITHSRLQLLPHKCSM